jgi:hypothetical protein
VGVVFCNAPGPPNPTPSPYLAPYWAWSRDGRLGGNAVWACLFFALSLQRRDHTAGTSEAPAELILRRARTRGWRAQHEAPLQLWHIAWRVL